jgi:hypothetical protein
VLVLTEAFSEMEGVNSTAFEAVGKFLSLLHENKRVIADKKNKI